ncbi:MAG: DUF2384 domain-containing protein [Alphaproteobacteria bacterium]|nr:MAG: DUF2384 domain-containing protein [Alphaproteobacteria bacterium]
MRIKPLSRNKRRRVEAVVLRAGQSCIKSAVIRDFLDVAHPELDGCRPLEVAAASDDGLRRVLDLLDEIDRHKAPDQVDPEKPSGSPTSSLSAASLDAHVDY